MIVIAVTIVTLLSVVFIRNKERRESDQLLLLLCETGERNLDNYFNNVQKSVQKVATFAKDDIEGLSTEQLERHIDHVGLYFEEIAARTNGVLTYYYRIDPALSDTVKGFWFTNLDDTDFVEHEVTDITLYDVEDTSKLVWFTVPRHTGEPVWLPPYITDNLDVRVISYNIPIYWKGIFIGVAGIEIDYTEMAKQVESIRLYHNGYAFLNDAKGNLFYHPRIDISQLKPEDKIEIPDGVLSESTFLRYTYDGIEKQAAWLPLSNGMRLNVTVPTSEAEGDWQLLITEIIIVSTLVLLTLSTFTLYYTRRITKSLEDLTKAAEQLDQGIYDFNLEYNADDEVGRLTNTFKRLSNHVKDHISDLNTRAYVDALTSVKNKGAFAVALDILQMQMNENKEFKFAIGVFDCNDLKLVNDQFGHDKGDIYLQTACRLISKIFKNSTVYRIGGDEFSVILEDEDFDNLQILITQFDTTAEKITAEAQNKWEQVRVARGFAIFDSTSEENAIDVVRRADQYMYSNKREIKKAKPRSFA